MRRLSLAFLLLLAACADTPKSDLAITDYLSPYRIDVRQGNLVTQDMVAQLKPGQTKDQVRFILGTPLITDPFHAERWDYIYRFQPGRGKAQQRRFSVYFQEGKLVRVGGDVAAAEAGKADAQPASSARVIDIAADPNAKEEPVEEPKSSKPWYWPF